MENQEITATYVPQSPQAIIEQAVAKGLSVEVIDKLLGWRREFMAEQAKVAFDRAMAAFQMECPTIKKDKEVRNDSGKLLYKYAQIDSIVEQAKPFIGKNNLSYAFKTEITTERVKVICTVKHAHGHSEPTDVDFPMGSKTGIMSAPQAVAATVTFAKRYAFCNAFGIMTGDEDTDAAAEVLTPPPAKPQAPPRAPVTPPIPSAPKVSPKQVQLIQKLIGDLGLDPKVAEAQIFADFKKNIVDLTAKEGSQVIDRLINRKVEKKNSNVLKAEVVVEPIPEDAIPCEPVKAAEPAWNKWKQNKPVRYDA